MAERMTTRSKDSSDGDRRTLPVPLDTALFRGDVDAAVVLFHENERPLAGMARLMDWRLHGTLSHHLKAGAISGREGEIVYAPTTRHGRTIHLILLGAGPSEKPGARTMPSGSAVAQLRKNLEKLSVGKIGVSRADFGGADESDLQSAFKEIPLWLAQ